MNQSENKSRHPVGCSILRATIDYMNTALITGASSGIGKEFAKIHAEKGGDVILVARSKDELDALAKELSEQRGVKAHVIAMDLSEQGAVKKLEHEVTKKQLKVDYLFNNAGFGEVGSFLEIDYERQSSMIDLNIKCLTELTYVFGKEMAKRKQGWILNVASTAAFQPGPGMAVYFATKSYVLHVTEALAEEWKGTGITITALCPGATETGFAVAAHASSSGIFAGKLPTAREVAEYGYQALLDGKVVAIHGLRNRMILFLNRVTPRSIVRKFVKRIVQ